MFLSPSDEAGKDCMVGFSFRYLLASTYRMYWWFMGVFLSFYVDIYVDLVTRKPELVQ